MATLIKSFAAKLVLAALLFAVAPVLVYQRLAAAETQRNALLLKLAQEQGRLAAEAVLPLLDGISVRVPPSVAGALARVAGDGLGIKLLFQPKGAQSFLFVAAAPDSAARAARAQLDQLVAAGILDRLARSCQGGGPAALVLEQADGEDEFLTHISSRAGQAGCWAVLTVQARSALPPALAGEPFWRTPQIQAAAAIYLILAVLVLSLFTDVWTGLRRFRRVARNQLAGAADESFAGQSTVAELADVAAEIDSLLAERRRTEALMRQVAEENAHALKGPLAVIAQSLEPLRRAIAADNARASRSLDIIAASVERLDGLVSAARRIDRALALVLERPRRPVDVAALVARVCRGYVRLAEDRGIRLDARPSPARIILGGEDLLEILLDNLLDNALDFAPAGSLVQVTVSAQAGAVFLAVRDQGPGIPPERLEQVFERHHSSRDRGDDGDHYGLGLWLVRRNAEAMGGAAWAENNPQGGVSILVRLPLAGR